MEEQPQTYNAEDENKKIQTLKTMIETDPTGVALVDASKVLGLSYSLIRKYVKKWGYRIIKKKMQRIVIVSAIVKD
jgi:hypothetical protein